ncbi:MAG: transposase [Candidatus Methylomirabilales bacterium]
MARPLRIEYPGALYHVTSRGNARQSIFKDDQDRRRFLATLKRVTDRYRWLCHAYCLMNNHYHLVVETPEGNLANGMRQLNGVYTQSYNWRHHRSGHLFQGRYTAILVQKESHLLEVCRYVVLNPVRARAVERPEQWKWSSYRGTVGLGKPHPCLTRDWVLGQFGKKRLEAEQQYRAFVKAGRGAESIWKQVKGQSLLGKEHFVERLIEYVRGREEIKEIPRSQRFVTRPALVKLLPKKVRDEKAGRDRKIVEAVERYGYAQREVADFLGVHYSTISRLVSRAN